MLIGSSMVGKTKMAAHLITEEFEAWPVAIPDSKTALADLEVRGITLQDTVIWLDDIDRFIGAGGITDGALRRLAESGNVIIGTIRAGVYDQFRPSAELRPLEWDVLSVFKHAFISRNLSQKEQERLALAIDDTDIQDRICSVGLGEYVGAAQQVADALKLGAAGTNPLGYALVLAAADWRRCQMTSPIPRAMLARLAEPHLGQREQALLTDENAFNAGLSWATRDINRNVALLQPVGTEAYNIYDYALDLITAEGIPIPENNWAFIIANAGIPELISVGYTAAVTYHRSETAALAWRRAAESGHPGAAPRAAYNLGTLLQNLGEVQGVKEAYQIAIDSGDEEMAPLAIAGLGSLLAEQGDTQGAKAAYQKAIESGSSEAMPMAVYDLGRLLENEGDVQGARDAFQKAIDSKHASTTPLAALNLGTLLENQGDIEGAKDAYQITIDSAGVGTPIAAFNLGLLLGTQGDIEGAKAAYRIAISSGHTKIAPSATLNLGILLENQGDLQGAKDAYQIAINSEHATAAPKGACNLGALLERQMDAQGAKEAYQMVIDSGDVETAPGAALNLGALLERQMDAQGAKEAYQIAIDSGDIKIAPAAALSLGVLLEAHGDAQGAKEAYQIVIDSGDVETAPAAALNLGVLLETQGDAQGAKMAYQIAIDSGHRKIASIAAVNFVRLPDFTVNELWGKRRRSGRMRCCTVREPTGPGLPDCGGWLPGFVGAGVCCGCAGAVRGCRWMGKARGAGCAPQAFAGRRGVGAMGSHGCGR